MQHVRTLVVFNSEWKLQKIDGSKKEVPRENIRLEVTILLF